MSRKLTIALGVAASLAIAGPAAAQKSKDTIRLAINDMFSALDPYHAPHDENAAFYRTIYSSLVEFDERKKIFIPDLAKSWKRINSTTLEFVLRDDVKFHNGDSFDANDVKTTFEYIGDPKTRIRFKPRFNWVSEVEILSPYKIRIHAKKPNVSDMSNLAYHMKILDGKVLNSLEKKSDYGRLKPVASGPYKVDSIDRNGVLVERFDGFFGGKPYYRAPVKFIRGIHIPDRQTQQAQLLTGGVDILRNITADNARDLAKVPNIAITVTNTGSLMYLTLDAAGRSSNKVMMDERVRKAVIMSIDRNKLIKTLIPGGDGAEVPTGIGFSKTVAFSSTTEPYPYNPKEAKRLLAEAGYPNGFDLTLYAYEPVRYFAEALAGELRKVGIKATIDAMPLMLYVKRRGEGKFTAFNGYYPTSAQPDMVNLLNFFFTGNRDYWKDPVILNALKKGNEEFDLKKRTAIYRPAIDEVNKKAYIYPISELPMVWAHSKDVKVMPNPISAGTPRVGDFAWADYKE